MTEHDLARLEALEKAATPGPWTYTPGVALKHYVSSENGDLAFSIQSLHPADGREVPAAENAELIVALRNAAPWLIAQAKRADALEAQVAAMRLALREIELGSATLIACVQNEDNYHMAYSDWVKEVADRALAALSGDAGKRVADVVQAARDSVPELNEIKKRINGLATNTDDTRMEIALDKLFDALDTVYHRLQDTLAALEGNQDG